MTRYKYLHPRNEIKNYLKTKRKGLINIEDLFSLAMHNKGGGKNHKLLKAQRSDECCKEERYV